MQKLWMRRELLDLTHMKVWTYYAMEAVKQITAASWWNAR